MRNLIQWEIRMLERIDAEFGLSPTQQVRLDYLRIALEDWTRIEEKINKLLQK